MTMKVYEALAKALIDNGVATLFGLIGDGNLFFVDHYAKEPDVRYIAAASEAGAALMALGYATASQSVGVATVTHGPALTNTVSALVEGVKGQLPIVLICGDTAALDSENLQNVNQRDIVIATGAGFEQARAPETVVADFAKALRRAITERRPIAFNVPVDFQWQDVGYTPVVVRSSEDRAYVPMSSDVEEAVGIIAASRRPVILAGRGAMGAEARAALIALAERTGALLATTLKAKDLFRGEPFNIGIMGTLSTPVAADALIEADCILSFGASLNKWTSSAGSFLTGKRIIQCNLDPAAIGRHAVPTIGLVGDAALTADNLRHWLDEAEIEPSGFRSDEWRNRIADYSSATDFEDLSTDATIDIRVALARFDQAIAPNRILVSDGGRFMSTGFRMIGVGSPENYVFGSSFGSIGFGTAFAIGAACAKPDQPVVLVAGDGGFMLGGLNEFNTAVRHGLDLIVLLCNDSSYGAEHIQFLNRNLDPSISLFNWPDFGPLAVALGAEGVTVHDRQSLDAAIARIDGRRGPILVDIKCDPERMPAGSSHR